MKTFEHYINIVKLDESTKKHIEFTDEKIAICKKLYDRLSPIMQANTFVKSVWNQMITKKKLTENQWVELEYILRHGKSRYQAGLLSTKH